MRLYYSYCTVVIMRQSADEEAMDAGCVDMSSLRRPSVIAFDVDRYPFREAIIACLGLPLQPGEDSGHTLEALRAPSSSPGKGDRGPSSAGKASGSGHRGPSTCIIQRWLHKSPRHRAEFDAVYMRFLREVVLKEVGDPEGLLFQRVPTFRCHVAGSAPTGRLHADADYGHQPAELNFWLPLTRASGANSLHAESSPGAGDFAPFELEYGECQRFWGARCRHHTVMNNSERTRVSIDFRVVPRSAHVPDATPADELRWVRVASSRPVSGVELVHDGLAAALQVRLEFSRTQWNALGVTEEVTHQHYVMSGGWCFQPAPPRFAIGGFYGALDRDGRELSAKKGDQEAEADDEEEPEDMESLALCLDL